MTYPPQPGPPHGQQPGPPHGQHPGWQPGSAGPSGHPQQGYPPQQAQFPPGQGPYPPPGSYGQPPMGGFGPQPPKKSRTGLVVGVCVAVVAVAAFAVTAFVAPGFLLGDDDSGGTTAGSDDSTGGVDAGDSEAARLVEQIVQGFLDQDEDGLNELVCSGSETGIRAYTAEAEFVKEFELQAPVEESGQTATATAYVALDTGEQQAQGTVTLTVANEGGGWCWKGIEENGSG